jgi:hypothetical protein
MHYRNKDGVWSQSPADIVRVDAPKAITSQVCHRRAKAFEKPTGVDNCRMFHLRGDYVAIPSSAGEEHPLEGVIVCFASTTSEYDFIYGATEQPRNLHSSFVNRLSCRAASPVAAGRITIWFFEDYPHRIDNFWRDGSTGIEIQVNASICSGHGSYYRRMTAHRGSARPCNAQATDVTP